MKAKNEEKEYCSPRKCTEWTSPWKNHNSSRSVSHHHEQKSMTSLHFSIQRLWNKAFLNTEKKKAIVNNHDHHLKQFDTLTIILNKLICPWRSCSRWESRTVKDEGKKLWLHPLQEILGVFSVRSYSSRKICWIPDHVSPAMYSTRKGWMTIVVSAAWNLEVILERALIRYQTGSCGSCIHLRGIRLPFFEL